MISSGVVGNLFRYLLLCAGLLLLGCHADAQRPSDSSRMKTSSWEEHSVSPLLVPGRPGSWNERRADTGNSILFLNGRWYLYHSGEDAAGVGRIGLHVTAGDKVTGSWLPMGDKPVLSPAVAGSWDSSWVAHPSVLRHEGVFWMYYGGSDGRTLRIGLARSGNGTDWKKLPGPVLSAGPDGAWDAGGVMHPSVIHDGKRFVMAYSGWRKEGSEFHSQIGIAVSADGLKWSRPFSGPVLGFGGKGRWDEIGLLAPRLWVENGRYYMNYSGKEAETAMSSLGHASADVLDRWTKSTGNPMLHHSKVRYHEIRWATPVWWKSRWYLLASAYFDGGITTLWQESSR